MLTTKQCTKCKKIKNLSSFFKEKQSSDGVRSDCKDCYKIRSKLYSKTKNGLIARIYGNQNNSSKKRGHSLPTYTKEELKEWLYSQSEFHRLYDNWKRLDFQKDYIPSVDRIDDYIGYTIDNIQIMTWRENKVKAGIDERHGTNKKRLKSVVKLTKNGEFIREYYSVSEAARDNNLSTSLICRAILRKQRVVHAGGFKWKYK